LFKSPPNLKLRLEVSCFEPSPFNYLPPFSPSGIAWRCTHATKVLPKTGLIGYLLNGLDRVGYTWLALDIVQAATYHGEESNDGSLRNMPVTLNGQTYYKTAEVCRMVGISRTTFFRWLKAGTFREAKYRDRRGWRLFTKDEVSIMKVEANQIIQTGQFKTVKTST
jgi:hypothetical protein